MRSNRREKESRKQCDRSKTPTKITKKKKKHTNTQRDSRRGFDHKTVTAYTVHITLIAMRAGKKKYTVICHLNSTGFLL